MRYQCCEIYFVYRHSLLAKCPPLVKTFTSADISDTTLDPPVSQVSVKVNRQCFYTALFSTPKLDKVFHPCRDNRSEAVKEGSFAFGFQNVKLQKVIFCCRRRSSCFSAMKLRYRHFHPLIKYFIVFILTRQKKCTKYTERSAPIGSYGFKINLSAGQ